MASTLRIMVPRQCEQQHHHSVIAQVDGVDQSTCYCGHTWCDGSECGLPALVTYTAGGDVLRARGPMVACGPVFQRNRTEWVGPVVDLVDIGEFDKEQISKAYWF